MQNKNKFMDDIGQMMTNAMGVAQGAKDWKRTSTNLPPAKFQWSGRGCSDGGLPGHPPDEELVGCSAFATTSAGVCSVGSRTTPNAEGTFILSLVEAEPAGSAAAAVGVQVTTPMACGSAVLRFAS